MIGGGKMSVSRPRRFVPDGDSGQEVERAMFRSGQSWRVDARREEGKKWAMMEFGNFVGTRCLLVLDSNEVSWVDDCVLLSRVVSRN